MTKITRISEQDKPKDRYKITNWTEYNQGLKRRGSLTIWMDSTVQNTWYHNRPSKRGGQYVYSPACIELLLILKSTFHLAFRQLEGFTGSLFELMHISLKVPSYTQICRRQGGLKVDLRISQKLKDGEGIHLVVDSSGLKIYGECEWKVRKHGYGKRRTWRKIHLGIDEKTGEIVAEQLTDSTTDDALVLGDIVAETFANGVKINKVGTDGAYDQMHCWQMLAKLEIDALIPPRENAILHKDTEANINYKARNAILAEIDKGGLEANRKGWKETSGYHRRSKSENGFFRWKIIFGEKMQTRIMKNQKTEATVKAAILNKFIQLATPVSVKVA